MKCPPFNEAAMKRHIDRLESLPSDVIGQERQFLCLLADHAQLNKRWDKRDTAQQLWIALGKPVDFDPDRLGLMLDHIFRGREKVDIGRIQISRTERKGESHYTFAKHPIHWAAYLESLNQYFSDCIDATAVLELSRFTETTQNEAVHTQHIMVRY